MSYPKRPHVLAQETATQIGEDIARLDDVITTLKKSNEILQKPKDFVPFVYDRIITATAADLQAVYTGVETIIERIAKLKSRKPPAREATHKALLLWAKEEAIVDEDQYEFLRRLSALRHFVRHAYGTPLDFDIVKKGADETLTQWPSIKTAMTKQQEAILKMPLI